MNIKEIKAFSDSMGNEPLVTRDVESHPYYIIKIIGNESIDLCTGEKIPFKEITINEEQKRIIDLFADLMHDEILEPIYVINKCKFTMNQIINYNYGK